MVRTILAVGVVILVFGATLVVGGGRLGAWDSPPPAAAPGPDTGEAPAKPRRRRARKPARPAAPKTAARARAAAAIPSWVAALNALCRSAEALAGSLPPPQSMPEVRVQIQNAAALSERWNRKALTQLARAAGRDPQSVRRLRQLFTEERSLLREAIAAAERSDVQAFGRLAPQMVANGTEQSRLLVGLGARDCALPENLT